VAMPSSERERESAGQIPFNEKVIIYIMKYKPIVSNKYKD